MSECAALNKTRVGTRVALAALLGVWLAGCSSDSTRLSDPFTNPFATASNDPAPMRRANVASNGSMQSNGNFAAAAHSSPVAVAALPPPTPPATGAIAKSSNAQPITGFGDGWRASGGSAVVVADGENLDAVSRRYGVPSSALLKTNGFTSASQVHGGVHLIIPVYDAASKTASADGDEKATPRTAKEKAHDKAEKAERTKSEKSKSKDADADAPSHKAKDKLARDKSAHEKEKASDVAEAKPAPSAKPSVTAKAAKPNDTVAKADLAPPASPAKKKPNVADPAPTGSVHPEDVAPSTALTGAQADAAGVSPEFRWPARGRIIQGFKAGGNDGINIAVPEGTSVKAAESGVVAYAGSELKGYGNLVLIRHPNGFVSAYANNGELSVKRGESVKRGQIIAKSGQSGNVSSPQLHFELRKGSTPVDPTSYLAGL
jgi:murein DD-endopeptidase MepM/ murein hydrolase activator NlpD